MMWLCYNKKYKNVKFDNPNEIINELIKIEKTKLDLRQPTFKEYCILIVKSRFLENSSHYSEISIINAEEVVRAFEYDLDYSTLYPRGLSQIIQCLTAL